MARHSSRMVLMVMPFFGAGRQKLIRGRLSVAVICTHRDKSKSRRKSHHLERELS